MTPLTDALTAAQRRALTALEKAYVAGHLDAENVSAWLIDCGITDPVDTAYLLHSLDVLKEWGASLPDEPQAKTDEQATPKQLDLIRSLCGRKELAPPHLPLTKAQASEIIDSIDRGTYEAEKWAVPF